MSKHISNNTCRSNTGKPMSKVAPLCIQGCPPVPRAVPSVAGIRGCTLLRAPGLGPPPCTQDFVKLSPLYPGQAASSVSGATSPSLLKKAPSLLLYQGYDKAALCLLKKAPSLLLPRLFQGCPIPAACLSVAACLWETASNCPPPSACCARTTPPPQGGE